MEKPYQPTLAEQQLEQILNMLPASVVVIRGDDLIVETINEANLNYWNKTKQEVIGRPFLEILPDLANQPFAGQLREVMRTGKVIEVKESPVFFANPDGSIRETYVDYSYQPLVDAQGNRNGVLVMSFEITERVLSAKLLAAANQELLLSEARFKYFIQEAPVAIGVLHGRELIIESANEMILKVWGKSAKVIGLNLALALPELEGQPFLKILDEVYTSGIPFSANEIRSFLEYDGVLKEIFFNVVYQPIQNETGLTNDILIVATDVTEQVNARKKAERAEDNLRLAIDAAELGAFHINVNEGIFVASQKLKEFFGYLPDEEISYKLAFKQIHPDYRHAVKERIEDAISQGLKFDMEFPVVGAQDQKLRWVRGIGTFQQDHSNLESYFTGVLHEITERKQDEQRKNDFIAMVSHELKTPLTSLNAMIQVLYKKMKENGDPFTVNALAKSLQQVKKMTSMISGFLNVSRLESGKIHLDKTEFDLVQLAEEWIRDIAFTHDSHQIVLSNQPQIMVHADRDKIGSVISNLLSNAIKYSPKGKVIEVSLSMEENTVRLSVKDEGMGIKQQSIGKIFDRYFRVETHHTQNISGFGIGLYLSAEIISHHSGKIGVESESGVGSTFWFQLPI